eukprot:GEMP01009450.1.p1 GENE.GEMP01009450.1~~GEMP01009450.1.p1  ORF type:complete len:554 (+),score=124.61 GEMP01009450.1:133-1794(+)
MDFLPFKEPAECSGVQLTILTAIYGYVLFTAAGMIGDGSELLLLVPSVAGLVGCVVLPVLGAVPDGMMVLFSGLGKNAQEEIAVGVGALAGSTIMLLTIPWFLAVYVGRVDIKNGKPTYSQPKLDPEGRFHWTETGVGVNNQILKNGRAMLLTMLSYLVVQIPASLWAQNPHQSNLEKGRVVNRFALLGLIFCILFFIAYLAYQLYLTRQPAVGFQDDEKAAKIMHIRIEAIKSGKITLRGAMHGLLEADENVGERESRLLELSAKDQEKVKKLLRPFFLYYDGNRDNILQRNEFGKIMRDLNEFMSQDEEDCLFQSVDMDNSQAIDFEEFAELMVRYTKGLVGRPLIARSIVKGQRFAPEPQSSVAEEPSASDEEEEEIPEDLADLTPEEQQQRIKIRSLWMMGIGTLIVLIISDPAVGVLNDIGMRLGISPFYVSFVLAPVASNASELVAAYNYGRKRTQNMMTISLSTLLGAACMNNTFCLAIFYGIIYAKELVWSFSAETMSIILVEVWVGYFAISSNVQTMQKAGLVILAYPLSLILVYVLENVFGFD